MDNSFFFSFVVGIYYQHFNNISALYVTGIINPGPVEMYYGKYHS